MPEFAITLSPEQKLELRRRYGSQIADADLSYGTVEDYCDSADHVPFLSRLQGDLKDLQRPAALKTILRLLPPGSRILEVGAGEPVVAHALSELGYIATIVDPYDGSGHGPTEFQQYRDLYKNLQIISDVFTEDVIGIEPKSFDCIYSISVLEHVHQPALSRLFRGIQRFLKPGGFSVHFVDHVLEGDGKEFHLRQLGEILTLQAELAGETREQATQGIPEFFVRLAGDLDTYYLSAEGHNLWRGQTPYSQFPYRKVVSVNSWKQAAG